MVGGFGQTVVNFLFLNDLNFYGKRGSLFLFIVLKAGIGWASSEPWAKAVQAVFGVAFESVWTPGICTSPWPACILDNRLTLGSGNSSPGWFPAVFGSHNLGVTVSLTHSHYWWWNWVVSAWEFHSDSRVKLHLFAFEAGCFHWEGCRQLAVRRGTSPGCP